MGARVRSPPEARRRAVIAAARQEQKHERRSRSETKRDRPATPAARTGLFHSGRLGGESARRLDDRSTAGARQEVRDCTPSGARVESPVDEIRDKELIEAVRCLCPPV